MMGWELVEMVVVVEGEDGQREGCKRLKTIDEGRVGSTPSSSCNRFIPQRASDKVAGAKLIRIYSRLLLK